MRKKKTDSKMNGIRENVERYDERALKKERDMERVSDGSTDII